VAEWDGQLALQQQKHRAQKPQVNRIGSLFRVKKPQLTVNKFKSSRGAIPEK